MPPVLKEMMRHTDIKTTMKYYVSINADQLAGSIWSAYRLAGGEVASGTEVVPNEKRKST